MDGQIDSDPSIDGGKYYRITAQLRLLVISSTIPPCSLMLFLFVLLWLFWGSGFEIAIS